MATRSTNAEGRSTIVRPAPRMTRYTLTPDTLVETDEGWSGTWAELCDANAEAIASGDLDLVEIVAALCEHGRAFADFDEIRIVGPITTRDVEVVRVAPDVYLDVGARMIRNGLRSENRRDVVRGAQTAVLACLMGA